VTSLALLSSAAYSSQPAAFTTTSNNHGPAFSTRVRKRVLARTFLHATMPTDQSTSEFVRRRPRTQSSSTTTTDTNTGISSSSTLSMIVDAQKEFDINLGRAMDTLKTDYPVLLTKNPQWHIYHPDLEVIDPTGVSLHGLENYKMAFGFIHGFVNLFYCAEKSGLVLRVIYDQARKCIRISWNVELVPRMIYGGTRNMLHVDGISEYYLDRGSGLITEHKVSHLLINNQAVEPENGIFNALAEMSPVDPEGVPVFFKADQANNQQSLWEEMMHVKFQTWNPLSRRSTSLFSNSNEQAMQIPSESSMNADNALTYDADAFQRKNDSRKKFGMPPLSPEEFVKIEEEVRSMDAINKKKASYMAEKMSQKMQQSKKDKEKVNFLSNIFGGVLKNGCESNFDCERPQVCCDVGFKKICCSNGLGIVDGIPLERWERATLRVPMTNDNMDY